ncbi:MAG: invasion associated locus B family protein [Bauldia sp.]|nr:invasion associated locus B family protein [Bauldia sp.]MCW5717177.1 invasion associated locus B family protein [Bauldia sp.]
MVAASAFALGVATSGQALAQQDPTAPGWIKVCQTDAAGAQSCSVVYQIVAENGQLIGQASLTTVTGQTGVVFSVLVRTGVLIQQGIRIQVDTNQAATMPYALCDTNICIGEVPVDDAFIASLKRGNQLMISTAQPAATEEGLRRIDYPMTLAGFTATYDGPGLNGAEAQARQDELNQALQDRAEAARQRLIEQQQQILNPAAPATP